MVGYWGDLVGVLDWVYLFCFGFYYLRRKKYVFRGRKGACSSESSRKYSCTSLDQLSVWLMDLGLGMQGVLYTHLPPEIMPVNIE